MRETFSSWAKSTFLPFCLFCWWDRWKKKEASSVLWFVYSAYFVLLKLILLLRFLTKYNFPFTPSFLMWNLITSCCSGQDTMFPQALISHAGSQTFCRIDFWTIALESEETMESSPEGLLTPYKPQSASKFDSQVGNNAVRISTFHRIIES